MLLVLALVAGKSQQTSASPPAAPSPQPQLSRHRLGLDGFGGLTGITTPVTGLGIHYHHPMTRATAVVSRLARYYRKSFDDEDNGVTGHTAMLGVRLFLESKVAYVGIDAGPSLATRHAYNDPFTNERYPRKRSVEMSLDASFGFVIGPIDLSFRAGTFGIGAALGVDLAFR